MPFTRLLAFTVLIASLLGAALAQEPAAETLDEIVVTGQKRDQALRDVNASVAVYDGETIAELTFTDITELYQFTPNVQAPVADDGDFSIRGVNFRGENLSLTSNVGSMYVDGIFQSTLGIEAGPSGIFDIQQVEIYRGVQSTIQGRNALAAAIHIRTADPTFEWSSRGRVEYAEYDTRRYGLAFSGPILEDQVAFRASLDEYESDGFLQDIENAAVFFDGEYALNDSVSLLFGARFDNEEYSESGVTAQSIGIPVDPGSLQPNLTDTDYDAFLPKLGVRWDQSDNLT